MTDYETVRHMHNSFLQLIKEREQEGHYFVGPLGMVFENRTGISLYDMGRIKPSPTGSNFYYAGGFIKPLYFSDKLFEGRLVFIDNYLQSNQVSVELPFVPVSKDLNEFYVTLQQVVLEVEVAISL